MLLELPVPSTAHTLPITLLQPSEPHLGFFLSGKCWLGWIWCSSFYMMMHNLGIRKIIQSLFHRALSAYHKMSIHGLVRGWQTFLQAFIERWFMTHRDFLGTFSCSFVLWSGKSSVFPGLFLFGKFVVCIWENHGVPDSQNILSWKGFTRIIEALPRIPQESHLMPENAVQTHSYTELCQAWCCDNKWVII